ncbi:uncharacterized protein [Haliotis cracherodii]|uniref:uncharacterized protein n=1 Tax=Haliotis cracherodii TaxID=6455 RepID=UPI0039E7384A
MDTLETFYKISGLKMNFEKTKAIWIGSMAGSKVRFCPNLKLDWHDGNFEVLGICFNVDLKDLWVINTKKRLDNIYGILSKWKKRNLTLMGKITVVKTLILSTLVHIFSALPNPSKAFIDQLNRILFNFIWSGKRDKIKRDYLKRNYSQGGLKMTDIPKIISSLKKFHLAHIYTLGASLHKNWEIVNPFWKDTLIAWSDFMHSYDFEESWRQNIDKNLHSSSNLTISPWIYDLTRSIKGTKVFYNKLIGYSLPLPKSCLKWENQLGCSFPWKQIFSVYCHGLRDTKLRDFQFRFIHKVIFTKRELLRMKLIDNDECSMCHTHKENIFHVYIECHVVKNFWSDFCIYLTHILHRKILITDNELLFGTSDVLINHLIVAAKRFIFVQCIKNENVDFVAFKNTIRSIYDVEYHIARRKNDFFAFNRKWALFPQTAK